jgi:hypothetical protein
MNIPNIQLFTGMLVFRRLRGFTVEGAVHKISCFFEKKEE